MPAAVVIPTYREAGNVARVVAAVRGALPGAVILVVDDASDDGTADLAEAAGAEVLRREGARGLGPAYRAGFARALDRGWDPVFQMDADLSHDPDDLPRLDLDADLVLGSRWVPGGGTRNWGLGRRLLSRFGSAYARAWLDLPFRDLTGGFKRWRAELLRRVDPASLVSDGYAFQVEATLRAARVGARIVEVPIVFTERTAGASKMSAAIALEAALRVPRLRTA